MKRSPIRNAADYEFVDNIGRYLIEVIRLHCAVGEGMENCPEADALFPFFNE